MPNQTSAVPIYVMLLIFAMLATLMFSAVPPTVANDILDGFVLAATMIGAIRFGSIGTGSIMTSRPSGPNFLTASAFLICVSICLIRLLRIIGLELGIIASLFVNYIFGAITTLMAFGIILLVVSPELHRGQLHMSRIIALVVFVGLSTAFSIAVYLLRTTI